MAGEAAVRLSLPSRDGGEVVPPWEDVLPGPGKHVHLRHDADFPHVRILHTLLFEIMCNEIDYICPLCSVSIHSPHTKVCNQFDHTGTKSFCKTLQATAELYKV